jgi:hypothetical protein
VDKYGGGFNDRGYSHYEKTERLILDPDTLRPDRVILRLRTCHFRNESPDETNIVCPLPVQLARGRRMTRNTPAPQALVQRLEKIEKQNRTLKQSALALAVALAVFVAFIPVSIVIAQNRQPTFYFGGRPVAVGMPKSEAVAAISRCCTLSPPAENEQNQQMALSTGHIGGHMILPKEEPSQGPILGSIFFLGGKVESVARPLGEEDFAPWGDDAVGFARAFYRALSPASGVSQQEIIYLSVQHERAKNAETEIISLSFPNGRGVRFNLINLDRPLPDTPLEFGGGKTAQVTLEEFLEPVRP